MPHNASAVTDRCCSHDSSSRQPATADENTVIPSSRREKARTLCLTRATRRQFPCGSTETRNSDYTMWWGVRSFEGRRAQLIYVITGMLIWLCACLFPVFYATPVARAVLMAAIGVGYTLLAVFELWRSRKEEIRSCRLGR